MASKIKRPKATAIAPEAPIAPKAPAPTPAPKVRVPRRIKKPVAIAEPTPTPIPEPTPAPVPAPRNNTEFFGDEFNARIDRMVDAHLENLRSLGISPSPKRIRNLIDTATKAVAQSLKNQHPNVSPEVLQQELDKHRSAITKKVADSGFNVDAAVNTAFDDTKEKQRASNIAIIDKNYPDASPEERQRMVTQINGPDVPEVPSTEPAIAPEAPAVTPVAEPEAPVSDEPLPDAPSPDSMVAPETRDRLQALAGIEPSAPVTPTPSAVPTPSATPAAPATPAPTPAPAPTAPSVDTSTDEPKRLIPKPEAPTPEAPEDGPKRLIPKGTVSGKPATKQAWQTPQAHTPRRTFGFGDKLGAAISAFKDPSSVGSGGNQNEPRFAKRWKELQELLEKEGIDGQTLTLDEWSQVLNETAIGKELLEAGFWKPYTQPEKFGRGGVVRTKDDGSPKMNRIRRFRTTPKRAEVDKLTGIQASDAMKFQAPAFPVADSDLAISRKAVLDARRFAAQMKDLGVIYNPNSGQITVPKSNATGVAALQQMKLPVTQDQEFGRSGTFAHKTTADPVPSDPQLNVPHSTGQPTPAGDVSQGQRLDIKQLLALRDIRQQEKDARAMKRAMAAYAKIPKGTQQDTEHPTLPSIPEPMGGSDDFQEPTPMPRSGGRTSHATNYDEPDTADMDMSTAMDTSQSAIADADRARAKAERLRAKKAAKDADAQYNAQKAARAGQPALEEERYTLEEWKSMLEEAGYNEGLVDEGNAENKAKKNSFVAKQGRDIKLAMASQNRKDGDTFPAKLRASSLGDVSKNKKMARIYNQPNDHRNEEVTINENTMPDRLRRLAGINPLHD